MKCVQYRYPVWHANSSCKEYPLLCEDYDTSKWMKKISWDKYDPSALSFVTHAIYRNGEKNGVGIDMSILLKSKLKDGKVEISNDSQTIAELLDEYDWGFNVSLRSHWKSFDRKLDYIDKKHTLPLLKRYYRPDPIPKTKTKTKTRAQDSGTSESGSSDSESSPVEIVTVTNENSNKLKSASSLNKSKKKSSEKKTVTTDPISEDESIEASVVGLSDSGYDQSATLAMNTSIEDMEIGSHRNETISDNSQRQEEPPNTVRQLLIDIDNKQGELSKYKKLWPWIWIFDHGIYETIGLFCKLLLSPSDQETRDVAFDCAKRLLDVLYLTIKDIHCSIIRVLKWLSNFNAGQQRNLGSNVTQIILDCDLVKTLDVLLLVAARLEDTMVQGKQHMQHEYTKQDLVIFLKQMGSLRDGNKTLRRMVVSMMDHPNYSCVYLVAM